MSTAHEETHRGCKIKLVYEDSPESPREWDNVGTMLCWHRRYNLGDEQPKMSAGDWFLNHVQGGARWEAEKETRQQEIRANNPGLDEGALDDLLDAVERQMEDDPVSIIAMFDRDHVRLPLYLYDHSGITISTGPFSCPWDSGQVGFIYVSLERARKEWPGTDAEAREKAATCLRAEVSTYDAFLTGQVVGWIAEDPAGEEIGSVRGYYPDEKGNWPDAVEQAKAAIDVWANEQEAERAEAEYWACRDVETVTC